MTDIQKQSIKEMRGTGIGYKKIAQALDLPPGTVQSFCRRKNITAAKPVAQDENHCRQCHKTLIQTDKVKKRKFCSDECRVKWWTKHPCSKNTGGSKSCHAVVCGNCGMIFAAYGKEPRKYCSHKCYAEARFGGVAQ